MNACVDEPSIGGGWSQASAEMLMLSRRTIILPCRTSHKFVGQRCTDNTPGACSRWPFGKLSAGRSRLPIRRCPV